MSRSIAQKREAPFPRRGPRRPWSGLVDLVDAGARPEAARRRPVAVAVAAEGERRLDSELALEPRASLLPSLLVLEFVLVQGGRLPDAVRGPELHRELGRLGPDVVPGRPERELI